MVYRCIKPKWLSDPKIRDVREGQYSEEQLHKLNEQFYNIYFFPNYPSVHEKSVPVEGCDIDTFNYVFVDMDEKDGKHTKASFLSLLRQDPKLAPSFVVDSGNGIHAYWSVSDLDPMSFLRLQRRLCRKFDTDPAVSKICQLMRLPGTVNTKKQDDFKLCEIIENLDKTYTCEELDNLLPPISIEDEEYCKQHFETIYKVKGNIKVDEKIPVKFTQLLRNNSEVKDIWLGKTEDRSRSDYRLGHIMFASGFTKEEALSVLVNSSKAITRAPFHRVSYAQNIIDKIWTFELEGSDKVSISQTVRQVLEKHGTEIKGVRFPCWRYIDATANGFRLGQVIGLVAGSGVGKTTLALNMFMGFVQNNPDYDHFFVSLEQPANEIADHWKTMCGEQTFLYDKVHIISNYADDGSFRHLSLAEIKEYVLEFQKKGKKVGCIVIDHLGALKKKDRDGENQAIIDICHEMKAFAIETQTLTVMQSQSSREKAGIGDLELNKDAAYGTVFFESYVDYLITLWQPLKRCHSEPSCPTTLAFKFCKIRHKKIGVDEIQEDVCYRLYFDPISERLRELTQEEEKSFEFFLNKATNKRKMDRKTDILTYKSRPVTLQEANGKTDNNHDA